MKFLKTSQLVEGAKIPNLVTLYSSLPLPYQSMTDNYNLTCLTNYILPRTEQKRATECAGYKNTPAPSEGLDISGKLNIHSLITSDEVYIARASV